MKLIEKKTQQTVYTLELTRQELSLISTGLKAMTRRPSTNSLMPKARQLLASVQDVLIGE